MGAVDDDRSLPAVGGWELAARCLPAGAGNGGNGDWYDAFGLPDGRLAVAVGAATGHDPAAGPVSGGLRDAVRAYALLGEGPARVLARLDALDTLRPAVHPSAAATVLYLELDPATGRGSWASAGHPPPLSLSAGSGPLDGSRDAAPPIGAVGARRVDAREFALGPGEGVLAYTAGLVEHPVDGVRPGPDQLAGTVRASPPGLRRLDPWMDALVTRLRGAQARGGACVVAVRRRARLCRTLAPRPQAATEARELARRALSDWGLDPWADSVCLVVSELVTNALTHARTELTFELEVVGERVRAAVTDASRALPRRRTPGRAEEHGRGVLLVALTSARWGTDVLPDGKRVWAEIGAGPPTPG